MVRKGGESTGNGAGYRSRQRHQVTPSRWHPNHQLFAFWFCTQHILNVSRCIHSLFCLDYFLLILKCCSFCRHNSAGYGKAIRGESKYVYVHLNVTSFVLILPSSTVQVFTGRIFKDHLFISGLQVFALCQQLDTTGFFLWVRSKTYFFPV